MYLCGDSGDYVGDNGSVGIGSVSCASSNGWCGDNNNSMLLIILVITVIIIATILMLLIVMIEVTTITMCVS